MRARDRVLELGPRTLLMGVLNVTPDSFSDGGCFFERDAAVRRAWQIAEEGADILDVGGESTRPGALPVAEDEEIARVIPVLEALASYPIPISIDTRKPRVARAALEAGASIVNDIGGMRDASVGVEAACAGAAVVLMHMRGEPATMQQLPPSEDIVEEVATWAGDAVARAQSCGVSSDRIILDAGIGFGKTAEQNVELIRNLQRLARVGFPVLVATSRKSFIGKILDRPAGERIWGTAATVAAAIVYGAHIVRVHDVREMRDVVRITDAISNARSNG